VVLTKVGVERGIRGGLGAFSLGEGKPSLPSPGTYSQDRITTTTGKRRGEGREPNCRYVKANDLNLLLSQRKQVKRKRKNRHREKRPWKKKNMIS